MYTPVTLASMSSTSGEVQQPCCNLYQSQNKNGRVSSMDFIAGLLLTTRGHTSIVVMKMVRCALLRIDFSASNVADL